MKADLQVRGSLTIWKCTGGPPKAVMPMCQFAKKASRQPPQAAGEDKDASLDSTGCRALAMELMVSNTGLQCTD